MLRLLTVLSVAFLVPALAAGQTREEKVRADKEKVENEGFWIYNDLPKAYALARESKKPILVSMRCIPCEECVKLDDELIDHDERIRPLLEKFVCVRIVGTNGLDLNVFQYDTDQSFAMFMLNADKTLYGRFGTRSHRTEWLGDVSIDGLAEALKGALALHANYPANRETLKAKRGAPLEFASPEKYPTLKDKYTDTLNYEGDVVKSCIHCHQIGDARREYYWSRKEPIPEELLFPYPHPKSIGLILDPKKRARVQSVVAESPAAKSGFEPGDEILTMNSQPLISMADVQWVLHNTPSKESEINVALRRRGETLSQKLKLPAGWRRLDNPDWRVSSWVNCRMMTGGMRLEPISEQERSQLSIKPNAMALRVKTAGRYGPHGAAKRAGILKGDILIAYDGETTFQREADLFAYASENLKSGDTVQIKYLRQGRERSCKLPIQK